MDRIRRVGNSAILSELAKKGVSEGKDEERVESMNIALETVVGMKEEKNVKVVVEDLKRAMKAANVVRDKMVGKREETMRMSVLDWREWESVDCRVSELVIAAKCCNWGVTEMDLGRFASLKVFEVGDECFKDVNEVKLIGLSKLERVVIGEKSFTKHKDWYGNDPDRHFYLKNCERLRELKIGRFSFSYYSVCEIENVPSLEMIEMGELNEWSYNFYHGSLELKSDSQ